MADSKISALPASTTPLAGTEVLPIVQSSATKQVTVANLTAGRAVATGALTVTGDATLSTGNLVQGTAAKGINFTANTPVAGMTSQLLNWYEEGTWTGTFTAVTPPTTPITATGKYTRVGRQVTVIINFIAVNTNGASGAMSITGLPFTASSSPTYNVGTIGKYLLGTSVDIANINANSTTIGIVDATTTSGSNIVAGTGRYIFASVTYFI